MFKIATLIKFKYTSSFWKKIFCLVPVVGLAIASQSMARLGQTRLVSRQNSRTGLFCFPLNALTGSSPTFQQKQQKKHPIWDAFSVGAGGGTRTHTLSPAKDFELFKPFGT